MGANSTFKKKSCTKLSFDAIAALAGVDNNGKLIDYVVCKGAITIETFNQFVEKLGVYYRGKKVYLFLDNLRLHHSKLVATKCALHNIEIVFNASYSSEYNPVEVLWLLSKQIFRTKLIDIKDFKNSVLLQKIVTQSMQQSSTTRIRQ